MYQSPLFPFVTLLQVIPLSNAARCKRGGRVVFIPSGLFASVVVSACSGCCNVIRGCGAWKVLEVDVLAILFIMATWLQLVPVSNLPIIQKRERHSKSVHLCTERERDVSSKRAVSRRSPLSAPFSKKIMDGFQKLYTRKLYLPACV
jgi:hypothetical protein